MANLTEKPKNFVLERNTLKRACRDCAPDKIEIEIGDAEQDDFKPQFKIKQWDNETNFSMRAEEDPSATTEVIGGVVKYKTNDYEVHMYDKPDAGEDGGFEFEWVLPKQPKSNVFTATIQTKGIDFHYQPALTQEEKDGGASQPDNVISSYAVYHKTKRNNKVGGKEYRTGKAFHIYRPEAVDADGVKVWCELNINEVKGELTVTVPQDFLTNAQYPVVVDPTFGYTSIGASTVSLGGSNDGIFFGQSATGIGGNLDSITVALKGSTGALTYSPYVGVSNTGANSDSIFGGSASKSIGASFGWHTITAGSEALSSGDTLYVAWRFDYISPFANKPLIAYDSVGSGGSGGFNDGFGWTAQTTRNYSIYATYTESASANSNFFQFL